MKQTNKIILLLIATITAIFACAISALAEDETPNVKNFYVSCWSVDNAGKENLAPVGSTGEYVTWQEVVTAINGCNVSGYKDYRIGVMCGIDASLPYEINENITLPNKNVYLLLGNVSIVAPVSIKGEKNARITFTEWVNFGENGSVTNLSGKINFYAEYEWNVNSQKWSLDGNSNNNSNNNFFPVKTKVLIQKLMIL